MARWVSGYGAAPAASPHVCWMANDVFVERKGPKGQSTGEYHVVENPPPLFVHQIEGFCTALKNWPKRRVLLGAEGSQWPFMRGV
eukprot:821292-Alexandrium_andersonii.AAC.1